MNKDDMIEKLGFSPSKDNQKLCINVLIPVKKKLEPFKSNNLVEIPVRSVQAERTIHILYQSMIMNKFQIENNENISVDAFLKS